ncbi:MAG TPA: hypothetical protein VKI65_18575, partial [Gemmataceae bacterium]|nr:hypothetical protein [Gemmataceae bacterium]
MEVTLTLAADGLPFPRILLADSGAGSRTARFQLILDEDDCLLCGGNPLQPITLGGAYTGSFPLRRLRPVLMALLVLASSTASATATLAIPA